MDGIDLMDGGCMGDALSVELDELDLQGGYNASVMEGVQFPFLLAEGVNSEEEFAYLRDRPVMDGMGLPLFCYVEGQLVQIGYADLTIDSLLAFHAMGYRLTLEREVSDSVFIDVDSPEYLTKFIKL